MNISSQNSGGPGKSPVGSKTQDPRLDELLAKVADRQVDSFEELYDFTAPLVYGIVLRVLKDPTPMYPQPMQMCVFLLPVKKAPIRFGGLVVVLI